MKKKNVDKNMVSNYVKVFFVFIAVIVLVLFLRRWYLNGQELEMNTPVLEGVVTHQIKSNEIYNFINDNDTALVYMCVANDIVCRDLEKSMKKLITNNSLEDVIIYLNLSSDEDISKFYDNLIDKYNYSEEIKEYPTFLYFENSKINKSLSGKDIRVSDVEDFMKEINFIS